MELRVRNVNEAFSLVMHLVNVGNPRVLAKRPSRVGEVLEFREPVMTHYACPQERVLFCKERDANPFFHLFESMWMLAGRQDVRFPAIIVKRMAEFSDDSVKMQGAYGYRWRQKFYFDQIGYVIDHLRACPDSRRAVIQMWEPKHDVLGVEYPTGTVGGLNSKDIPCNTTMYFKFDPHGSLRMTVCNRSNDAIWGAYGANAVHMSILQEYIANKLDAEVGDYTQMSDSLHVYTGGPGGEVWERVRYLGSDPEVNYGNGDIVSCDLGAKSPDWDEDMKDFFAAFDAGNGTLPMFRTAWWRDLIAPMWYAWADRDATCLPKRSTRWEIDWFKAGREWLARHPKKEVL